MGNNEIISLSLINVDECSNFLVEWRRSWGDSAPFWLTIDSDDEGFFIENGTSSVSYLVSELCLSVQACHFSVSYDPLLNVDLEGSEGIVGRWWVGGAGDFFCAE